MPWNGNVSESVCLGCGSDSLTTEACRDLKKKKKKFVIPILESKFQSGR